MSRRAAMWLLFLLYATGALVLGVWPHEHAHNGVLVDGSCVACVWQISSATDVPVTVVTPPPCLFAAEDAPSPVSVPCLLRDPSSSRERAPPEPLA